jgi:hypothetical protein
MSKSITVRGGKRRKKKDEPVRVTIMRRGEEKERVPRVTNQRMEELENRVHVNIVKHHDLIYDLKEELRLFKELVNRHIQDHNTPTKVEPSSGTLKSPAGQAADTLDGRARKTPGGLGTKA